MDRPLARVSWRERAGAFLAAGPVQRKGNLNDGLTEMPGSIARAGPVVSGLYCITSARRWLSLPFSFALALAASALALASPPPPCDPSPHHGSRSVGQKKLVGGPETGGRADSRGDGSERHASVDGVKRYRFH